jgi:hypothetical protein
LSAQAVTSLRFGNDLCLRAILHRSPACRPSSLGPSVYTCHSQPVNGYELGKAEVAHRRSSTSYFAERMPHRLTCQPPWRERLKSDQPGSLLDRFKTPITRVCHVGTPLFARKTWGARSEPEISLRETGGPVWSAGIRRSPRKPCAEAPDSGCIGTSRAISGSFRARQVKQLPPQRLSRSPEDGAWPPGRSVPTRLQSPFRLF